MKMIKKYFDKLGTDFKKYLKKYPVTNLGLLVLSLFFLISDIDNMDLRVLSMITLFTIFSFNVETRFQKDSKKRFAGYIVSFIAASFLPLLCRTDHC